VVSERYTEEYQMTSNAPGDEESKGASFKNSAVDNREQSQDSAFGFGRPRDLSSTN